jgi:hypothetical protein
MASLALAHLTENDLLAVSVPLGDGAGGNGLLMAVLAVVLVFALIRVLAVLVGAVLAILAPLLAAGAAIAAAVGLAAVVLGGMFTGGDDSPDPPAPEVEVAAPVAPVACGS